MARFGGDKIKIIMQRVGWEEGLAIDGRMISKSIETAQKRVEAHHFEARKNVTEYDDVMNKQRQIIYNLRNKILRGDNIRSEVLEMIDDLLENAVLSFCDEKTKPAEWDLKALEDRVSFLCNRPFKFPDNTESNAQTIFDIIRDFAKEHYNSRASATVEKLKAIEEILTQMNNESAMALRVNYNFEQHTLLDTLDQAWNHHLLEMDHLREGITLRGYGQKNPLHEYQKEGFSMFQILMDSYKETAIRKLFFYDVKDPAQFAAQFQEEQRRRELAEKQMRLIHEGQQSSGDSSADLKSAGEQRAKMEALKKARRKAAGR